MLSAHIHESVYMCVCIYVCTDIHVGMQAYIYADIHVSMYMCVHTYVDITL